MEKYKDATIRARVNVLVGNPFMKTDTDDVDIKTYNKICELVKTYKLTFLTIEKSCVRIQAERKDVKHNYLKNVTLDWLEDRIKYEHDKAAYELQALSKVGGVRNAGWSRGIESVVRYAVARKCNVERDDEDNVLLKATDDSFRYAFNLNSIAFDQRSKVDTLLVLRRLELLQQKHNLK